MNDGLKDRHRRKIIEIFSANERVKRVVLFGSRAMETHTPASDVDLVLFGEDLTMTDQAKLAAYIEELPMPQRVDLLRYKSIKNSELFAHIKKFGVEWYRRGGVMSYSTIGDHVELQRGTTYKSALLDQPGPVLLGLGSIERDGGFRAEKLRTYGGPSPDKLLVYSGDLYVSLKDVTQSGDLLGSIARVPETIAVGRMTQDTVKLCFKTDISRNYLYWLLRTPQYRQHCRSHATGTTNLGLSRDDFFAFEIPELTDAREKITNVLESIEQKITLNRQINQTLEETAQAIFKSWFVDFDPVKAKINAKQNGQDPERAAMCAISGKTDGELNKLPPDQREQLAATAALFPDELVNSNMGLIPNGWGAGDLNTLSKLNINSWTKKNTPKEVWYVDIASTKTGYINEIQHYKWEETPSRARRILTYGDTIVGTVRPGNRSFALIGKTDKILTGSTGFAVLTPKEDYYREITYIIGAGNKNIERLSHLADGAAYPAVRPDVVPAIECVIPNSAIIKHFSGITVSMFDKMDCNNKESLELTELRDPLLPKLLSGEITIGSAQAEIKGAV